MWRVPWCSNILCFLRRRFDFNSPARIDRGMELFIAIHRDLAQSRAWEPPRLFFDSSVSRQTVQQLTEIVKRHQVRVGGGGGRDVPISARCPDQSGVLISEVS